MLEKFRQIKTREIKELNNLKKKGSFPAPLNENRPDFRAAISGNTAGIIAEIKKASPSRGIIREDMGVGQIAELYAANGASAISVLTERDYFRGDLRDLNRASEPGIPLLRKDFILDPVQIEHTAAFPASAVLLIVKFIDNTKKLAELIRLSEKLGLQAVVEIFSSGELDAARQAGAKIIQVNNRNLDTLETDLNRSRTLAGEKQNGETWICASGITERKQCTEMHGLKFDACLIGTSVMTARNPGDKLAELTGM